MLGRFLGERGRRLRVEALASQKIVAGNRELAEELADRVEVFSVPAGETLITQGGGDNAIYFVLSGIFDVNVNGRRIAARGPNEHVGEMAAVQPAQRRSADVVAAEGAIVAQLTEEAFTDLGNRYPQIFRYIAQELAVRLLQRNALAGSLREKIRILIVCSTEALVIARAVQSAFASDPFTAVVWTTESSASRTTLSKSWRRKLTIQTSQSRLRMPMIRPRTEERLGLGRETT